MGSNFNFKNFGNGENSGAKPIPNSPLFRQSSVYSLTFDEFQTTLGGGIGKDLGSMNMDELLKNIWTAEETNTTTTNNPSPFPENNPNLPTGDLQRQGSLTLPRTISQKTVDEVWRNLVKENESVPPNLPQTQRQPTLGEMTLEEFLARAGVVREDNNNNNIINNTNINNNNTRAVRKENNVGFFDEFSRLNSNNGLGLQFQSTQILENSKNNNNNNNFGLRSAVPHQQPLFPKPADVAFASPVNLVNGGQLPSPPRMRAPVVGMVDQSMSNNLVGLATGGVRVATGGIRVATASPGNRISPNLIARDAPSLSPVPNVFGRGRKGAALEKVIERRHKRMIKNRESAARSRARKQAYTMELEAEVAKLKEVNQELQKKQAEMIEMQKTQFLEKINRKWGSKRQCLWRTLTGPW